eukprot:g5209.t1
MGAVVSTLLQRRRAKAAREAAEIARLWAEQDQQFEEEEAEKAARIHRQEAAIRHVMQWMYSYAPINKRIVKYPSNSPKAGQKYLWITLAEHKRAVERKDGVRYPECVTLDREGNLFVAQIAGEPTERISSKEIFAAQVMPRRPDAPTLLDRSQTSITVQWERIVACVDRYELAWQPAGSINEWKSVSEFIRDTCGTLQKLSPNFPSVFRVRAHNMVGWSEWSPASETLRTDPGRPLRPSPPRMVQRSDVSIDLCWDPVDDQGDELTHYTIRAKADTARSSEWIEQLVTGEATSATLLGLDDSTTYYVQMTATNTIGTSDQSIAVEYATREAPLSITGAVLRRVGCWEEYWDDRRQRCVYLNTVSGAKQKTTPFEMRPENIVGDVDTDFRKRRYRFLRAARIGDAPSPSPPQSPSVGGTPVLVLRLERSNIFDDTFKQIASLTASQLKQRTRIEFLGEEGIDSGGLSKDWYILLGRAMVDASQDVAVMSSVMRSPKASSPASPAHAQGVVGKKRRLFRNLSNGHYGIDPRSCKKLPAILDQFYFCGQIIAKALLDRHVFDVSFDDVIIYSLLGRREELNSIDDLRKIDPTFAKSLIWILDNSIEGVMDETLSACTASGDIIDFVKGGRNIDVTDENKAQYVDGMIKFKLTGECQEQQESFCKGFGSVIPLELLQEFSPKELRLLMNGRDDIDADLLTMCTAYQGGGFNADSELSKLFWRFFRSLDQTNRMVFLRFCTGCPRVPLDGFDPQFTLVISNELDQASLPRSHTCFNQLVLPPYHLLPVERAFATLEEKLTYAMKNAVGHFGLT